MGLNLGHAALREDISAEVQRLAAIKEAAKAAFKTDGAQGAAPGGQAPQGSLGAQEAPPPAQDGQGLQQGAPQGCADPADGVPPAGKAGPQPKARRAGPYAMASTAAKKNALEKKKKSKPKKKKTGKKTRKTL